MIETPRIAVLDAGVAHALAERGRDARLDHGDAVPLASARASICAGARLARGSRDEGERS